MIREKLLNKFVSIIRCNIESTDNSDEKKSYEYLAINIKCRITNFKNER